MLIVTSLLAFYLAFNLGANDVANSMGTSVGSKAVSLRQALVIAGVLEFAGAVLFGRNVSETLITEIVNPELFVSTPSTFLVGMVAVLLACGLWLNIATVLGLPVSSSHATVGAIAGVGFIAMGTSAVNWASIGKISLTWILTPVASGAIAIIFYALIQRWILNHPQPLTQLREWIPWLSALLLGIFGVIVLPNFSQPMQQAIAHLTGVNLPLHNTPLLLGTIATLSLTWFGWHQLEVVNLDQATDSGRVEGVFGRFQLVSACFVAFAHGSNDVGNAVAPLAAIAIVRQTGTVLSGSFQVPLWILVLGGVGIVAGLGILGKRVISTIGENIIALKPSSGFCAELATATTVLLASQVGLPVSTSHALVGGVVGVGWIRDRGAVRRTTLKQIAIAWLATIPLSALLGMGLFKLAMLSLPLLQN